MTETLAVITPINDLGGIADYSENLYRQINPQFKITYLANKDVGQRLRDDQVNVVRLWELGGSNFEMLIKWLHANPQNIIHIQFHPATIGIKSLTLLLQQLAAFKHSKIYLTAHLVQANSIDLGLIVDELNKCTAVFVHSPQEVSYLSNLGLNNVQLFRMPINQIHKLDKVALRQKLGLSQEQMIVATHGIAGKHKGILPTAYAMAQVIKAHPQTLWLALNAVSKSQPESFSLMQQLAQLVEQLGIKDHTLIVDEMLTTEQILALLQVADIGLVPYSEVGESASASIRKFISAGLATIASEIRTFGEFKSDLIYKIPDNSPEAIAGGIRKLISNPQLRKDLVVKTIEYSNAHTWAQATKQLEDVYLEKVESN